MAAPDDLLDCVGDIVRVLRALGLDPVLVGGMALVVLGSRRVTRDFDFVVAHPRERMAGVLDLFYDRELRLVSRLTGTGDVAATIASREVAAIRLRVDAPSSAYFFNRKTGLRIELLFDFPLPAKELARRAVHTRIRTHLFEIASEPDLLRLKQIARTARSLSGDADDIAFLEARLSG